MKKILAGIGVIFTVVFICLLVNHISNENMIDDYNNEVYAENKLSYLGFLQPYIAPYNQGNVEYMKENYGEAIEQYKKALDENPSFERECLIRINMALAMVIPINPEEITQDNVEETIKLLEDAKEVLLEHGCAHDEDSDGHNEDAQQLKEDIDKFIEQLKRKEEDSSEEESESSEDETQTSNNEESTSSDDKKKKELEEQQKKGNKERHKNMRDYGEYESGNGGYDLYDGNKW